MGVAPAVLVLDDGELDDVQQMLEDMAIPFARVRGGAIAQNTPPPRDLLIATPRRIDAVRDAVGEASEPPVRVMVVNEDSNALRAQLRRSGFDYLVRRPVHPEALRLMLLHCCYKGEEKRREPRVAVGSEVTFRTGLSTRPATLVDLSSRGCRLLSRHRIERGKRVKVQIPEALESGDELLMVPARAVHVEEAEIDGAAVYRIGLAFEQVDEDTQHALAVLIEDRARGPVTLRGSAAEAAQQRVTPRATARAAQRDTAEEHAISVDDRRRDSRAAYSQTIPAFGERALRVLVGRDLSVGGMRVQPQPELWLGDRLQLAIYGAAGDDPMLIWGRIERSDGEWGLLVRFEPLDPPTQARLERLVASLPTVESLHDSEAEAMGTVLGEILLCEPLAE